MLFCDVQEPEFEELAAFLMFWMNVDGSRRNITRPRTTVNTHFIAFLRLPVIKSFPAKIIKRCLYWQTGKNPDSRQAYAPKDSLPPLL